MSVHSQMENSEGSLVPIHTPDKGSGFTTAAESPIPAIEQPSPSESRRGKATGPRTELGKQRASGNATKRGLFSKVVVLPNESRAEYERLLAGLGRSLQPEGALEELLVEKLAATAWRQRRLLFAEGAEIRKHTEFVESDQWNAESEEAKEFGRRFDPINYHGLIQRTRNPDVLERCLELLSELQAQIEKDGFNRKHDTGILETIYGDRNQYRLRQDLYDTYTKCFDTFEVSEEERVRQGCSSPEQCRKILMYELKEETLYLKRCRKDWASIETERTQLEVLRHSVPDAPGVDRLMRYEASLDRVFDRTLHQLERLQRIRRGQPVPPTLDVNISAG